MFFPTREIKGDEMGDMADYLLDSQIVDYGKNGKEPTLYLFSDGVKCKYCHKGFFTWKIEANGKWRLYDGEKPHLCLAYKD